MANWNRNLSCKVKARFRSQVANRFGFAEWRKIRCLKCNDYAKEGKLIELHHVHASIEYPELRLDINNVVPLCSKCHDLFHYTYDLRFGRFVGKLASPEDLQEFLNLKAVDMWVFHPIGHNQ